MDSAQKGALAVASPAMGEMEASYDKEEEQRPPAPPTLPPDHDDEHGDENGGQHGQQQQQEPSPLQQQQEDGFPAGSPSATDASVSSRPKGGGGGARANYFTIVEAPPVSGTGGGSRGKQKALRRSVHRLGGPAYRCATYSGPPTTSFLSGTSAYLDPLPAEASSSTKEQLRPPPARDWCRLSYGGFSMSTNSKGGRLIADEPWICWGPAAAGVPSNATSSGSSSTMSAMGAPFFDYEGMQVRRKQEMETSLTRRIEEVRDLLKKPAAASVNAGSTSTTQQQQQQEQQRLHHEALALASLKHQRHLWDRFLRWKDQSYLGGLEARGEGPKLINLPEGVVMKQRIRRQTRSEIKRYEREQKKRELDREEARRKKLRTYLQKVMSHREDFLRFHKSRKADVRNCGQAVKKFFESRDKKVEREKDNEEKMRLQALKNNDMDEYIRLVETTRNERLNYLIQQTDAYIAQIADMVQAERGPEEEQEPPQAGGGLGGEDRDAGMSAKARGYYAVTHRRTEEVIQPLMLKGGDLKEYQIAGLQWMVSLYNNKLSGILADEMGLGKTIQSISLITYVMEVKGNLGPFLIVVPLSTLSNWVNEFNKWAPDVLLVQYKGSPDERKAIYREEMESGQYNVLLTTYDFVMKDKAILRKFEWEYIIVDEGHRLKNAESRFAQTLGSYYSSKRRLLLTGTPLQNNLPELWSLLNFLLPTIFDSPDSFDEWFNKPFASFGGGDSVTEETAQINEEEKMLIIQRLHELLRPFMLRRVKSAVMGQLPAKVEKVLKCDLSGYQRRLYRDVTNKALASKMPGQSMNNIMMHLRKVCNHPFLFQDRYTIDRNIVSTSGKLELLDRILPKLQAAGHRVLLFSQMTQMLDVLVDYFNWKGFRFLRLDGSTAADDREERMYQFNAPDSPYFIFALSTRAGGLGLNLATADTVIFYDSDWNPSMDSQAMDRAHRIGQKNDVRVFRLITNTAVEEKIISRANEKSKITNLVVEAGKFNRDGKEAERRAMVESLLRDADDLAAGAGGGGGGGGGGGRGEGNGNGNDAESNVPDDDQLNDMMATTQEELELYRQMDEERDRREIAEWAAHVEAEGSNLARHPRPPRLAIDMPKSVVADLPFEMMEGSGGGGGGGGGAGGAGGPPPASAALDGAICTTMSSNSSVVDEDTLSLVSAARGRKRKDVSYSDKMTERQFMQLVEKNAENEEKEKKKKKGKKRYGKTVELAPQVLAEMFKIYTRIRGLKDEETGERQLALLFLEKPPKKTYPDYYEVIKEPIDLKTIRGKIKASEYYTLPQFAADFRLLFQNAYTYNADDSIVYMDAAAMSRVFEEEYGRLLVFAATVPAVGEEKKAAAGAAVDGGGGGGGGGGDEGGGGGGEQSPEKKKAKKRRASNASVIVGVGGGGLYDEGEF